MNTRPVGQSVRPSPIFLAIIALMAAGGVLTLLSGCGFSPKAAADPVDAELNTEFALPGGQEATIRGEDLRVKFVNVLEDSRCPTEVECFWTGQARIVVEIAATGGDPVSVEFNTNPAPGQTVATATVSDYTIELLSLEPYPETIEQSIPLGDYRALLYVRTAA